MTQLIERVLALVSRVSPAQVEAVAARFRGASGTGQAPSAEDLLGTPSARSALDSLLNTWGSSETSGDFLAGLLVGASHARERAHAETVVDLVWTGPTTPSVATRRTAQVLLDLIRRAEREIYIVSFVAYDVQSVVEALNAAINRGVRVRVLLESPTSHGGSLDVNPIATMREAIPDAELYSWQDKSGPFVGGRVHAKVAVADATHAFLTSANLTGHALEKNIEAGVVITGGPVPTSLRDHLEALIGVGILGRA